jgi:[histone H3]-lysine79 N-trimethyltransferase
VSDHVTFDKDSDNDEDDSWMKLDADVRKRQRKGTLSAEPPNRRVKNRRAFEQGELDYIHAVQVASLKHGCVPIMGAGDDEVPMELQYPSSKPREK